MINWLDELKLASIEGVFKLIQNHQYTTIKIVSSNIFPEINNNLSRNLPRNLIKNVLKLRKLWTAISPRLTISGKLAKDHWKRRIFPFKTLFRLSRYDFRFLRYPRVKEKIFFSINSCHLLGPLVSLTYPKFQSKRQTRFLEETCTRYLEERSTRFQEG